MFPRHVDLSLSLIRGRPLPQMLRKVCALLILRHCGKSQHSLPNISHFVFVRARRASASRTFSTQARSSFNGIKFTIRSGGIFAAKAAARARSMNSNCQRPGDRHAAKHRRLRSLAGKDLGDFGITRWEVDARLQFSERETLLRWTTRAGPPHPFSFRPQFGKEKSQLLRPNVN
jgi:hypothetical protein